MNQIRTYSKQVLRSVKDLFLHGIFLLLPIILTASLVHLFFRLIKSWLSPIYELEPAFLHRIPHSEILITFLLILLAGVFYDVFLQQLLYRIETSILKRIPLLSLIYFGLKRLTAALTSKDKTAMQQVMLVEFPSAGVYSIGFLTGDIASELIPHLAGKHVGLFVPHTPNPTTGFYIMVPESKCAPLDLTRQEAMSLIISGGLVSPQRFVK